ncbi:hypothetical protein ACFWPH_16030 [Nocardia sp. NPDC058499]|uniref:hypothetical protein n=1 Tax=Nocardia sp. NPDC058499 TaxID=3346530 RepID=UPI00364DB30B
MFTINVRPEEWTGPDRILAVVELPVAGRRFAMASAVGTANDLDWAILFADGYRFERIRELTVKGEGVIHTRVGRLPDSSVCIQYSGWDLEVAALRVGKLFGPGGDDLSFRSSMQDWIDNGCTGGLHDLDRVYMELRPYLEE